MTDIAGLLDSLSLAPSLPGALCAGRHELFDASIEASRTGTAAAHMIVMRADYNVFTSQFPRSRQHANYVLS